MSYYKAKQLFYATSSLVITIGLFLVLPFGFGQVGEFKADVNNQFTTALQQTMGDQPFIVDDLGLVWSSINNFYDQSADATLALLEPGSSEDDLVRVVRNVYTTFTTIASEFEQARIERVAGEEVINQITNNRYQNLENFMAGEPLYNIVPDGAIAGEYIVAGEPLNTDNPWVTMQDNITGQLYCVAIFNNEVNKYLGPCKYDSE